MRRTLLFAVLALTACATGAPVGGKSSFAQAARYRSFAPGAQSREVPAPGEAAAEVVAPPGARGKAVELARSLVGKKAITLNGKAYGEDCVALIKGVFDQLGLDVVSGGQSGDNGVTAIYRFASTHGRVYEGGRPVPGDLVFFRETYDLNKDGRDNDGLTHVGLVEAVADDGTVSVLHRVSRGVARYRMNLSHPAEPSVNDVLRLPGAKRREVLTGQLFAAYATVLPIESRFASR